MSVQVIAHGLMRHGLIDEWDKALVIAADIDNCLAPVNVDVLADRLAAKLDERSKRAAGQHAASVIRRHRAPYLHLLGCPVTHQSTIQAAADEMGVSYADAITVYRENHAACSPDWDDWRASRRDA